MTKFIVITENDESNWDDKTGVSYNYPPRYKGLIQPGVEVVYYKGKLKDPKFRSMRISDQQHYFGTGRIAEITKDNNSKNYFANIVDFRLFNEPVGFKNLDGSYVEMKANLVDYNYFRGNAVRSITKEEYEAIISRSSALDQVFNEPDAQYDIAHTTSVSEGKKVAFYTTKYERNKKNRDLAIKIHGFNCAVCNINFRDSYGEIGEGFIHIHHVNPLHTLDEEVMIDPVKDLIPVCPNCHAMIHRKKEKAVSIDELRLLFKKR